MTRCGACGRENPATFRFCGGCGSALSAGGCPSCGFENPPGLSFCGRCGAPQQEAQSAATPPPAAAPTAGAPPPPAVTAIEERKLATVVFADVVGFTALAETTDPETLSRSVDAAFRDLAAIVHDHGGTVDKYMGDSLMAVFGVPFSHGDDAERAVAAALVMAGRDGDLRFSIGVNSGEVMVTAVAGGGVTVMGDTVNVAARLEKVAGAGEVLVGPLTAELVSDRVDLRERDAVLLKGKREPLPVFEALGLCDRSASTAPCDSPPLVDREEELAFLTTCWRRAVDRRRGSVVVLTGDPGVGKTRLVEELVCRLGGEARVARATCPAYGGLGRARVASDLAAQLGIGKAADSSAACADGHAADAATAAPTPRADAFWALRRMLARATAERPLLLVLDDVHHAGAVDLDPLVRLVPRLGDLPLLLLLLGRPEPGEWLGAFTGSTTVRLDPLAPEDASRLAAALAGDPPLAAAAADLLATQSGGNPLHLRELVRLVRARGEMVAAGGSLHLRGRSSLPPSLQAVLAARLDALGGGDKAALQGLAVYAGSGTAEQVEALGVEAAGMALDRLVTATLVHQGDGGEYRIVDPLLREVAYEALPHDLRGRWHRVAATAVGEPAVAARHLDLAAGYVPEDGALRAEAAAELAVAGLRLVEASRFPEAAEFLGRALELGNPDPLAGIRLAQALTEMGHCDRALETLDRIAAEDVNPTVAAEMVHARGYALTRMGHDQPRAALPLLEEAERRWRDLDKPVKVAWALANQANAHFDLGRFEESAVLNLQAVELFLANGERAGAAITAQMLALTRPDDPRVAAWLTDALALSEELGDLSMQRNARLVLAWFHYLRDRLGDAAAAQAAVDHAAGLVAVSKEIGDDWATSQGHLLLASLARLGGDLNGAEAALEQAGQVARQLTALHRAVAFSVALAADPAADAEMPPPSGSKDPFELMAQVIAVESLLFAGRAGQAAAHVVTRGFPPGARPTLARLIGIVDAAVLVQVGRGPEAEAALEEAREAAQTMGSPSIEALAVGLLAEAALQAGDRDAATALLATVIDPGGIAGAFLDRARARLGDAEARRRVGDAAARLRVPGLRGSEAGTA